jgi:putative sterol carrier protein
MKLLLDIKDSKAEFVLELLKNLPFVKTKEISPAKAQVLGELKEAVDNMKLVNEGKLKARSARDLANEL